MQYTKCEKSEDDVCLELSFRRKAINIIIDLESINNDNKSRCLILISKHKSFLFLSRLTWWPAKMAQQ